jgi:hypothetical protein
MEDLETGARERQEEKRVCYPQTHNHGSSIDSVYWVQDLSVSVMVTVMAMASYL